MARDTVAITALGIDATTADPAGTTIVPDDGAVIEAAGNTGKLLVVIRHTDTIANDATFVAPTDSPQAVRSSLGDLVTEFAAGDATTVIKYFVIEGARFAQTNGDIHIDFESTFTGTIAALRLPDEA